MELSHTLLTDSTGAGMAGAEDVSLEQQKKLKETYYNGSKPCVEGCGNILNPVQSLHSGTCSSCARRKQAELLKKRMSEK